MLSKARAHSSKIVLIDPEDDITEINCLAENCVEIKRRKQTLMNQMINKIICSAVRVLNELMNKQTIDSNERNKERNIICTLF